eukprot:99670-Alexandrium_andersonii.AAC.1
MSASLVGSEMCIRDRVKSACAGAPKLRRALNCSNRLSALNEEGCPCCPCLLYTSDAADDM